jgi:hypothetical protein
MTKEEINNEEEKKYEDRNEWKKEYWMKRHHHGHHGHGGGGAVYGLGFIGALVYYWQHANTFWVIVMGLLKSIAWPAMLVWHLFSFLKL